MYKQVSKLWSVIVCVFGLLLLANSGLTVEYSEELFTSLAESVNDIPQIAVPEYERIVLDNGMVVYLVEDHQFPLVELHGYIRGGRRQESPDLPGVADLMVQMMNTGTKNLNEYEFSRYKEAYGLDLELSIAADYFQISGNALSVDLQPLIELTADMLQNPQFDAPYFQRKLMELYQLVNYAFYQDEAIAEIFFNTNIYGYHPYANESNAFGLLQVLPALTPDHLQMFYENAIDPAQMVLVIVGDINVAETIALLQDKFGSWPSQGIVINQTPVMVNEANYGRIILVHKPDATQAKIRMGYNFYDQSFSDRVEFRMANLVFGSGGFTSRLMDVLRSQKGYAYGIYSSAEHYESGGIYIIDTNVAPERACESLDLIREQMQLLKTGEAPITEAELFSYINYFNAFFPQAYQYPIDVMAALIYRMEFLGDDANYINDYIARYNSVTAAKAQAVFQETVFPENLFTVIVGNKEQILPAFTEKGIDVEVIDLF